MSGDLRAAVLAAAESHLQPKLFHARRQRLARRIGQTRQGHVEQLLLTRPQRMRALAAIQPVGRRFHRRGTVGWAARTSPHQRPWGVVGCEQPTLRWRGRSACVRWRPYSRSGGGFTAMEPCGGLLARHRTSVRGAWWAASSPPYGGAAAAHACTGGHTAGRVAASPPWNRAMGCVHLTAPAAARRGGLRAAHPTVARPQRMRALTAIQPVGWRLHRRGTVRWAVCTSPQQRPWGVVGCEQPTLRWRGRSTCVR